MKKRIALFLVLTLFISLLAAGCAGNEGPEAPKPSDNTETKTEAPETKEEPTEPASEEPSPEETKEAAEYRNLCAHFLDEAGVDVNDMWTMYDWDTEGKYVTTSHSLECAWGNGYGKSYLFDGVKASDATMFDMGAYLSCTVKPGWGEFSGELDDSTVTWKKNELDEWIRIDLQDTFTIDKVTFSTLYATGEHGMPSDFTIAVSTDGENFTTVIDEVGYHQDITSKDQVFTFDPVEARYVHFHFTKGTKSIDNNLAYSVGLSEIEVWGR